MLQVSEPVVLEAPARLVVTEARAENGFVQRSYFAEGADGERVALLDPVVMTAGERTLENGWVELYAGCGTSCAYAFYLDGASGRISGTVFYPIAVDAEQGLVAAISWNSLFVLDPFEPESVRQIELPIELDCGWIDELASRLIEVSFIAGQDVLSVIVYDKDGNEQTHVVPLPD